MNDEEYIEYRRLEIAIDLGGNAGDDIYDFNVYCEGLEAKYGKPARDLFEDYVVTHPDCR